MVPGRREVHDLSEAVDWPSGPACSSAASARGLWQVLPRGRSRPLIPRACRRSTRVQRSSSTSRRRRSSSSSSTSSRSTTSTTSIASAGVVRKQHAVQTAEGLREHQVRDELCVGLAPRV